MGLGLQGVGANPASPPYRNGPYEWDQHVTFTQGVSGTNTPGPIYYVDRNLGASGDGKSWTRGFKTITEAITAVNTDYTAGRINAWIFIGEGYYSEVPVTLTASDVTIVCIAPGYHDSTVLYGSGTAGSFAGTTTAPALTISGDNNTIYGLGVVNRSAGLQPAILVADGALANHFIKCGATKDAADSCTYGIEDMGNAYTKITDCVFTISCKIAGIRLYSATNQSINIEITNCRFIGGPTGLLVDAAAHNCIVRDCVFIDDTSDTAETMDTPILNNGGASLFVRECYSAKSTADLVTGAGTSLEVNNFQFA